MKIAPSSSRRAFSLTAQYALTIIVLMVISLSILTVVMLYSITNQNEVYIKSFGSIISKQLAASAVEPVFSDSQLELEVLLDNFATEKNIEAAGIYSLSKEKLAIKGNKIPSIKSLDFSKEYQILDEAWRFGYTFSPRVAVYISPITFKNVTAGYAVVIFSQELLNEQFIHQVYAIAMAFCLLLFIVIIISIIVARRLSRPIRSLVDAAESIRQGKLDIIYDRRSDELGALIDAINTMSQGLIRKDQVENMLDRVLSKDVKRKVMDELDPIQMAGEHVNATVLFADIVGFTSISEKISPEEVQDLLNEYYSYFNACARFYFGTVDKYIGDCVMVLFGVPKADPKHQYNAISCAILMQKLADELNMRREKTGQYPIELRIGINSGKMMAGLIGSDDRMEYTVVGDAVNLASRLCSEADGSQIIIEESMYDSVNPLHAMDVEAYKNISVRGKQESVAIYSVLSIEHSYKVVMDDLIEDILSKH